MDGIVLAIANKQISYLPDSTEIHVLLSSTTNATN